MRSFLLALVLGGCPDVKDDVDGDADTDADSDADADADADAWLAEIAPCPAFSGLGSVGWAWAWHYTEDGEERYRQTGDWDASVTSRTGDATAVSLVVTGSASYVGETSTYTTTSETDYSCDADGARIHAVRTDWVLSSGGSDFTGYSDTVYDPPALYLPATAGPGATWSVTYAGTTTNDTSDSSFEYTAEHEAGDPETITVPAGELEAIHVTVSTDGTDGTEHWISSGTGLVAGDGFELVSVSRP